MLKDKLNELKAAAAGNIPPETMATMQRTRAELTNSGILDQVIKVGEKLSDFTLPDAAGQQVSLAELRRNGPVLISLYRGVW